MQITKWVSDRKNGSHWVVVCHACRTVTHQHKDMKQGRCTDCGALADRPEREQKFKTKKKAGFV